MKDWAIVNLTDLITESRIPATEPNPNKRIRVKLNVLGVEKRPFENEVKGATKQFIRKSGQFIYGKQNFHKGAFGIVPDELEGFETSADIPSFDVRKDCLPEWVFYFFKIGNRYLELEKLARGVGSKRIHPQQLSEIKIPLPSINEQNRIVKLVKDFERKGGDISSEIVYQLDLIKQLRQSFLCEAMKGKLTENWRKGNPDIEPASVLLRRIKNEKERLIKEGKLKKDKTLPPIKPEEIPFEIPESWVWCRLGDVVQMSRGRFSIRPRNDPSYFGGDYPFIQIGSLDEKGSRIFDAEQTLNEKGIKVSKCFPENTIVVAIVGGTIANLGVLGKEMYFTDSMVGIYPNTYYNQEYILNFLRFVQPKIKSEAYQMAGQPNIKIPTLTNQFLPLPSLEEQEQIVHLLNKLMNYCDELETKIIVSQEQTGQLLQVALKEALEPKVKEVV